MEECVPREIMVIAGEASGDHYGAGLIQRIREKDPSITVWGMGGDRMKEKGMEPVRHIRGLDVMGFWDVLVNIRTFRNVFAELKTRMESRRPDAVVCIDYPGFNIRFARAAHAADIPVVYFISPKVWAWNAARIPKLAETVTKMIVFFEFEKHAYEGSGLDVVCVGHPLVRELEPYRNGKEKYRSLLSIPASVPFAGILPGSREREVRRMFPVMLKAARILKKKIPDIEYKAACAPSIDPGLLRSIADVSGADVRITEGAAREIMAASDALMITSGTATLEAGIIGTPHTVCYRIGTLTYFLIKPFLKTEHIGLVNVAAGKKVAEEFLQGDMKPGRIADEMERLITDREARARVQDDMEQMRQTLNASDAYARTADEILTVL